VIVFNNYYIPARDYFLNGYVLKTQRHPIKTIMASKTYLSPLEGKNGEKK